MEATCPKCSHKFDVMTKETDQFGFVVKSKGSLIAGLIAKKPGIKVIEILQAVDKDYPQDNSIGRIQSVITKLTRSGQLTKTPEGGFKMIKVKA